MYKSDVNIKHTNKSHLYWGIDKSSGDVVYIDDVALRGLNCNCKCAACLEPLYRYKSSWSVPFSSVLCSDAAWPP